MIVERVEKGVFLVNLWWRNQKFLVYFYSCKNLSKDLASEVKLRGLTPDKPVAIIPARMIKGLVQLVQGAVHYKIYAESISRIKNKGLLLALLITGRKQLKELVDALELSIKSGEDYYIISLDEPLRKSELCTATDIEAGIPEELKQVVKNVDALLSYLA